MKFFYSLAFFLATIVVSRAYSSSWGYKNTYDNLLSRQVEIRAPMKNYGWEVNPGYPRAGSNSYHTISYVSIVDNFRNNSGAAPTLRAGGPGFNYASISLLGQYGYGMNTTIEIWGR